MSNDLSFALSVTRSTTLTRPAQVGFGTALVLSGTTYSGAGTGWNTSELTRTYADMDEVDDDWGATTPEYLCAQAYFAGDNPPDEVVIGKYSAAPALKYTFGPRQVLNSTAYKFAVNGQTVSFTSDASATNDEIVSGLKTAFDALAIANITSSAPGSVGSTRLQLLGNAGVYFYPTLIVSGVNYGPGEGSLDYLDMLAATAEPGTAVATQIANIRAENDDWYAVVNPYPGLPINTAIAAYIEGKEKFFLALEPSTDMLTVVDGSATDLAKVCETAAYNDTMVLYHGQPVQFADAAWLGLMLPTEPGTDNWAWGTLTGVTPSALTSTHITNIEAKNGNWYREIGGYKVSWDGHTGAGTYVDFERWYAKLRQRWREEVAAGLKGASPGKIPQNDRGIQVVYGWLYGVLENEARIEAINPLDSTSLIAPRYADISAADKAARLLSGYEANLVYTGATNTVSVTVKID